MEEVNELNSMSKEELKEELKNLKKLKIDELDIVNYVPLKECEKRLEEAKNKILKEKKRELREEVAEELKEMGEIRASLKLYLKELRGAPQSAQAIRDRAQNLISELGDLISKMENKDEQKEKKAPEKETERKEGKEKEEKKEEEPEEALARKIELAKNTIKNLQDRIRHIDRINRELSTKLETLESRRRFKNFAVFFGGILLLLGAITVTGGFFLTLAREELAFVYAEFPRFFSYLLILLGGTLVTSGFLHQV
ncbi:MAG: hypothetical protein GWO20_06400 [Candidatus Korarchaeota archaeon]|nr:hypothetical protein [Candidatus Korarchaeota archaeon]NIU83038.1 hypothetical protein [Candidatus Thorarchaeota archaeon]NIW15150.1 hypothetical protein [Candidatus Thorarchaeota archaeon]NIW51577.1 hypothetical protein [Candidatus Korarchaeota archaeon]